MPITKGYFLPLKGYYAFNKFGTVIYSSRDVDEPRWFREQTIKYDDMLIYTGGWRINRPQPFIKDYKVIRILRGKEVIICDLREALRKKKK